MKHLWKSMYALSLNMLVICMKNWVYEDFYIRKSSLQQFPMDIKRLTCFEMNEWMMFFELYKKYQPSTIQSTLYLN